MAKLTKRVGVAGDLIIDWNLARTQVADRSATLWDPNYTARAFWQLGGAAMLCEILQATAQKDGQYEVEYAGSLPNNTALRPGDAAYNHSYTICSRRSEESKLGQDCGLWRVESFLGFEKARAPLSRTPIANKEVDLLVIDDGNSGFRDLFAEGRWPDFVPRPRKGGWIVLKWARPLFGNENHLWHFLQEHFADRLIAVFTVNDLRLNQMKISRELSWEETAQDVQREIEKLAELRRCAAVVVSFYTAGAVVYHRHGTRDNSLYYDPNGIEGQWFAENGGRMAGYTQSLVAAIVHAIINDVTTESLGIGVRSGVAASRLLHSIGFQFEGTPEEPTGLKFPVEQVAKEIHKTSKQPAMDSPFEKVKIQQDRGWSMVSLDNVWNTALKIITEGPKHALHGQPICTFADFITVDRQEAESLRSIRGLVSEYVRNRSRAKPLSIAVFGQPGSGKSFAVEQVMEALRQLNDLKHELGRKEDKKEFNLSQFSDSGDLLGALHQIRDVALSGKVPLVLWDEFDAELDHQKLGWLRYFLAPMQDGKFQEGQTTHSTGRAVFVFAGGTSYSMEAFAKLAQKEKDAKGPDFLSRLKGYLNIPALDHKSPADPMVVIRRAILFRSMLERGAPGLFSGDRNNRHVVVDSGVARAFLYVKNYKHGARSMETIISMSLLDGKRLFERSSLPSRHLLKMHVEPDKFLSLI